MWSILHFDTYSDSRNIPQCYYYFFWGGGGGGLEGLPLMVYSPLHKNQFWYLLMYPSLFWTSCAPLLLHTLVIITMCNSKGGRGSMACWKEWRKQRRFAKKKVCEVFFWINIIINFCISSIKIPKSPWQTLKCTSYGKEDIVFWIVERLNIVIK